MCTDLWSCDLCLAKWPHISVITYYPPQSSNYQNIHSPPFKNTKILHIPYKFQSSLIIICLNPPEHLCITPLSQTVVYIVVYIFSLQFPGVSQKQWFYLLTNHSDVNLTDNQANQLSLHDKFCFTSVIHTHHINTVIWLSWYRSNSSLFGLAASQPQRSLASHCQLPKPPPGLLTHGMTLATILKRVISVSLVYDHQVSPLVSS